MTDPILTHYDVANVEWGIAPREDDQCSELFEDVMNESNEPFVDLSQDSQSAQDNIQFELGFERLKQDISGLESQMVLMRNRMIPIFGSVFLKR